MTANQCQFKTLVIIDLETTGLVYDEPKITELAMIAVPMYVQLDSAFLLQNIWLPRSTLDQMKPDEELPRVLVSIIVN